MMDRVMEELTPEDIADGELPTIEEAHHAIEISILDIPESSRSLLVADGRHARPSATLYSAAPDDSLVRTA